MRNLSSTPVITDQLFAQTLSSINKFCTDSMRNTKNILSEGDMQSWVFTYLQVDLREDSGLLLDNRIGIDCNLSYLSAPLRLRGKLNKYPDVIILDTDEYDTHESCDLYDRKGFTAWGSAIMLELKLLRTSNNINNQKKLWEKDIDKLDLIRARHYSGNSHGNYFPLFVLLCKQELPQIHLDDIQEYATSKNIKTIIFPETVNRCRLE